MLIKKTLFFFYLLGTSFSFLSAETAALARDTETFEKAEVLEIKEVTQTDVAGTEVVTKEQILKARILGGPDTGKIVNLKNDHIQLSEGDVFYARHQTNHIDSSEYWSVSDPYRLTVLFFLTLLFVALIFLFGGIQGVRGLVSLIGSFFIIFYLLIPSIYSGHSVILVSISVASLIIIVGSYITHGFNRTTTSAVLGMIATVLITGIGAYYVVDIAQLSGYSSEESVYLNLDAKGSIDMVGLLFGGIMIGLLGVLYDVAIGQAVSVEELCAAGKHLTRKEIYRRALRIGREHIGALVNTLAIAYVGASLPLLLLIQSSTVELPFIINSEIFATEIVRILIGSIGIILAVPVTTLLSCYLLYGKVTSSKGGHHH